MYLPVYLKQNQQLHQFQKEYNSQVNQIVQQTSFHHKRNSKKKTRSKFSNWSQILNHAITPAKSFLYFLLNIIIKTALSFNKEGVFQKIYIKYIKIWTKFHNILQFLYANYCISKSWLANDLKIFYIFLYPLTIIF